MIAEEKASRSRGVKGGKQPIEREQPMRHIGRLCRGDLFTCDLFVFAPKLFESFR